MGSWFGVELVLSILGVIMITLTILGLGVWAVRVGVQELIRRHKLKKEAEARQEARARDFSSAGDWTGGYKS